MRFLNPLYEEALDELSLKKSSYWSSFKEDDQLGSLYKNLQQNLHKKDSRSTITMIKVPLTYDQIYEFVKLL